MARSGRLSISARSRFAVLTRCRYACYYCGTRAAFGAVQLQMEHVIPVSLGGTNDEWNLVAACQPCNAGKFDRPVLPAHVERVRAEWAKFAQLTSDRPVIVCDTCSIPVFLPEGDEAYTRCMRCVDSQIDAFLAGKGVI